MNRFLIVAHVKAWGRALVGTGRRLRGNHHYYFFYGPTADEVIAG